LYEIYKIFFSETTHEMETLLGKLLRMVLIWPSKKFMFFVWMGNPRWLPLHDKVST